MAIATGTALAIGAGVAAAGAGVAGAAMSASASKKAAKTQAKSARDATQAELEMYYQSREDLAPYREVGARHLRQLSESTGLGGEFNLDFTMADFQRDPGYQFRLAEGQKAIERSAAARGMALSGPTMKDLTRFSQGLASDEYQRAFDRYHQERTTRFNRLASLAGIGQTATTATAQLGAQTAQNIGQNVIGAGNALAAGQVGAANAINQGIAGVGGAANSAVQNYLLLQALRQPQYPTYGGRGEILMP